MVETTENLKDVPSSSSDEESLEEPVLEDHDTCTPFDLKKIFQQKYIVKDETAATLKKDYIISLAKDDSFTRLASGLSDGSVHLFDISCAFGITYSSPDCVAPLPMSDLKYRSSICGLRFMDETPNLLLVGTTDHLVRLFDLRLQGEVLRFQNDPENHLESPSMPNEIVCFDRNSNSRVLCVGTEQYQSNAFLIFYDVRERKQLGGCFESHQDDVTTVRFHPENPDILCSGSTDGLINIFDIQKSIEDDALLITFNTVSSVHKVNWHKNVYGIDIISGITHTNDFKLYDWKEGDLIASFERTEITESIKRKTAANCNLIDCHNQTDGGVFLLTGSNRNKGEIMRSLLVQNKDLVPAADFQGNKQIVRDSVYDMNSNTLVTAGENGIVTMWTQQSATSGANSNLKAKKTKSIKLAPY